MAHLEARSRNPGVEEWRCAIRNCNKLLAMKHIGGVIIVRYKDHTVEVSGNNVKITIPCRHCGARNCLTLDKNTTLMNMVQEEE